MTTRGGSDDLLGLRAYRPGDDTRQVHWRKTAAAGHLVLREHTAEGAPEIEIELDDVSGALDAAKDRRGAQALGRQFEIPHPRGGVARRGAPRTRGTASSCVTTSGTRI